MAEKVGRKEIYRPVLIRDSILMSPTGDGTATLRSHPSNVKVWPFAVQKVVPSFLSHFKTLSIGLPLCSQALNRLS